MTFLSSRWMFWRCPPTWTHCRWNLKSLMLICCLFSQNGWRWGNYSNQRWYWMTTIVNLNSKSDSTSKRSPIASLSFWFQGLLSTTYQVEVTFSVKGGAEEQKSIFVKVFLIKVCYFKNTFMTYFTTIAIFALKGATHWEQGPRLQGGDRFYQRELFCDIGCVFF